MLLYQVLKLFKKSTIKKKILQIIFFLYIIIYLFITQFCIPSLYLNKCQGFVPIYATCISHEIKLKLGLPRHSYLLLLIKEELKTSI